MIRIINYFKVFTVTALVPVFLIGYSFSIPNAQAADGVTYAIVFNLNNPADILGLSAQYGISDAQAVFANQALGNVYEGVIDESKFDALKLDSRVRYAQLNFPVSAATIVQDQTTTVNDPYFTLDSAAADQQWYLPKTQVPQAWDFSRGSTYVNVAIIDTGIHATHLDLNDGRVVAGYNVLTSSAIAANSNSDDNGHGTAVAGVIGAIPNNGKGVSGINWSVSLMPVKALDASGSGTIANIAAAIVWAADNGANIINMSLGGPGFAEDPVLTQAVSYAYNKNVLIIAAAGNDLADQGLNLDTNPVYPVCADGLSNMIIGVAATDTNDVKASFSNFGHKCVDISAPGKRILTTTYLPSDPSDNLLLYGSGTSMAAPVVTGIAALIKAAHPGFSNAMLRDLILSSADNIDSLNVNNCLNASCVGELGKGRINAYTALAPKPLADGQIVRDVATNKIYLITNGTKRYISQFVYNQRNYTQLIDDSSNQLASLPTGTPVLPLEGTLVKSASDATVYIINGDVKRPLTYLVFVSRNLSFANVVTLPDDDVAGMPTGDWYWPPDGTLVLINGNPTVYVMDQQVARPTTYFVFIQRKLSFAKVITVTADEFSHVPRPADSYWLSPLDGTLLKSKTDNTVYVIENGTKRALSAAAFAARKYSFKNVKVLPQAEVDVIMPGDSIF